MGRVGFVSRPRLFFSEESQRILKCRKLLNEKKDHLMEKHLRSIGPYPQMLSVFCLFIILHSVFFNETKDSIRK